MRKPGFLILPVFCLTATQILGAEKGRDIASELADGLARGDRQSVAVLPFEYQGRHGHPFSSQLAEEVTYWLVKSKKVTVVERARVDKLLQELAFAQTGAVNDAHVQKIGRGLGAQALVIGTITDQPNHRALIQARIVRTETFEVIAVAKLETRRDWEKEYVAPAAPPPAWFVDALGGLGYGEMALEFSNKVQKVNTTYLGMLPAGQTFSSITFPNLKTSNAVALGARGHFFFTRGTSAPAWSFSVFHIRYRTSKPAGKPMV